MIGNAYQMRKHCSWTRHLRPQPAQLALDRVVIHDVDRDHDRDDRHQQGDEPGHHGAEHEDQDDQRRWEAELELARLEVVLGERVEVVVDRPAAGHHDAEAVLRRRADVPPWRHDRRRALSQAAGP